MTTTVRFMLAACICVSATAPGWAQTGIRPDEWSHGTTLSGFVGGAAESDRGGTVLGGAVAWEMTPRFAIEGSGAWIEFGDEATAFSGALTVRSRLFGRRTVDPFVQAGVGMYRASFGPQSTLPPFYDRGTGRPRLTRDLVLADPSLVAGGGVTVFVNRRFAIRPDVAAIVAIRGDGRRNVVTTIGVHAVYHFEDHPVTPARRAQRMER